MRYVTRTGAVRDVCAVKSFRSNGRRKQYVIPKLDTSLRFDPNQTRVSAPHLGVTSVRPAGAKNSPHCSSTNAKRLCSDFDFRPLVTIDLDPATVPNLSEVPDARQAEASICSGRFDSNP